MAKHRDVATTQAASKCELPDRFDAGVVRGRGIAQ
jgi:hypothetical protein